MSMFYNNNRGHNNNMVHRGSLNNPSKIKGLQGFTFNDQRTPWGDTTTPPRAHTPNRYIFCGTCSFVRLAYASPQQRAIR